MVVTVCLFVTMFVVLAPLQVTPLPGQHWQQQQRTVGASNAYFTPLQAMAEPVPQLAPLLRQAADCSRSAAGSALHLALLQAAVQRLEVLFQQLMYLEHSCPVTLIPKAGVDAEEQVEVQRLATAQELEQQQEAAAELEGEGRELAAFVVAAAADEVASNIETSAAGSGQAAALQLATGVLPVLQRWTAASQLQRLLQVCLRAAVHSAHNGSGSGGSQPLHRCCRQLMVDGDLLEHHQLAAQLPAAAAAELGTALRQASRPQAVACPCPLYDSPHSCP